MPLAAELSQVNRQPFVTRQIQVIAPDMFSVITISVMIPPTIPPTGNAPGGSAYLCGSIGAGIVQLMNIMTNPEAYTPAYKVIAATTLVLQENYYNVVYNNPGTWISSLIAEASAQNPGFSGYIQQALAILV